MQFMYEICMLFAASCMSPEAELLEAITKNNCAYIEHILTTGPRDLINSPLNHKGDTALHVAATEGALDVVRLLLQYDAHIEVRTRTHEVTPLHNAAASGILTVVKALVEAGAEVNSNDRTFKTALYYAVESGEPSVVEYLLTQGAQCTRVTHKGYTPLHEAVTKEDIEIIELLLQHESSRIATSDIYRTRSTLLHIAAALGRKDLLKKLCAHGHVLDAQDGKGYTPLHIAVHKGHKDCVLYLIKQGADIDIPEEGQGRAPLHTAVHKSNMQIVSLLVRSGANVMARDSLGFTSALQALNKSSCIPQFMHGLSSLCTVANPCQKRAIVIFLLFHDTYENLTQHAARRTCTILDYLLQSCYKDLLPLCLHIHKEISGILASDDLDLPTDIQRLIRAFLISEIQPDAYQTRQQGTPQRHEYAQLLDAPVMPR